VTAVIGMADLMEGEVVGPLNDEQKVHLRRMTKAAWHLVTIIEEVLTFSRSEAGRAELHRSTIDLAAIAREVVDVLDVEAEAKGLRLRLEEANRPEFLFADGGKVRQIVANLVGNAVKFTDEGEVVVRLERGDRDVALQVTDTGPGVPIDQQAEVFEPFTQGDSTITRLKGGVGLGLAVSLQLARLLGGDIQLESLPGDGATFTLRLPKEPVAGGHQG
jgi:signal transduction histidine kinase